jgi:dienelactone hydrolase
MTDLATRIADVKQKAEAAKLARANIGAAICDDKEITDREIDRWTGDISAFTAAASPDLFLAMAARIEELEKALEPMVDALSKCVPGWEDHVWVDDNHAINMGHLRIADLALRGESTPDQTGDSTPRS